MMLKIWRQIVFGVAWGGLITFIALTMLVIFDIESSVETIWLYMGGSLFLGIYFGLAAFIFTVEQWSPLKKTVIHFILSISVYFIVAFSLGWVLFSTFAIIMSILTFTVIYCLFWLGFNLYYRKETQVLNKTLQQHKK